MKVAIIGANGFIGSRMVEQFTLGGTHAVIPVVRRPSALALPARFDLPWALADALDPNALANAVRGSDAVVHCAIGDSRQIRLMPAALCEAAVAAGIKRVVYLSSASVHGQNLPLGATEDSPLHTRHLIEYNNAKVDAENSLFALGAKLGLEIYALRPSVVFGPRSTWIADALDDLRARKAWLYGNGSAVCNTIYVDNLIHAVSCALTAAGGAGQAYLLADAEPVTWRQFYTLIAESIGPDAVAGIHQVDQLPAFRKSLRDRLDHLLSARSVMQLMPAFPASLKRGVKGALAAIPPPATKDHWTLTEPPMPRIDHAMALLQQCRHRITSAKATTILGYRPPVRFEEGMRRSLLWAKYVCDL